MRIALVKTLENLAKKDKNIFLLTGDLGFNVFENFISSFPNQFINAGIAEQNMTGIAAGMAMEGKIPFIYSIIPFCTMRNFEQIRNDICYQDLNVKIVGVGAGFSYAPYGHTHHALEDLGVLRTLPNLTIFCPADEIEAELVTRKAVEIKGPVYIRIGKSIEPLIHKQKFNLQVGKGVVVKEGNDLTIIAISNMVYRAMQVAEVLEEKKISVRIISMHTLKPLDENIILDSAKKTKSIFTLEEHFITGGLGSSVAEVLAENSVTVNFKRLGVPNHFTKEIGDHEFMRKINNLGIEQIANFIVNSKK